MVSTVYEYRKDPSSGKYIRTGKQLRTGYVPQKDGGYRVGDESQIPINNEARSEQQPTSNGIAPQIAPSNEQLLASDPNVVASSRNPGVYIGSSGERITPVASYEVLASGYGPGLITSARARPVSFPVVEQTTREFSGTSLQLGAAKTALYLKGVASEGRELSEKQTGIKKTGTLAVSGIAEALSSPVERYAVGDKSLGREIVISYGAGLAGGVAYGAGTNAVGRVLGPNAFRITGGFITAGGIALTGASGYVAYKTAGPSGVGRLIPSFVSVGVGFSRGVSLENPGVHVIGFRDLDATSGTFSVERPSGIVSGKANRLIGADISEYGVLKTIPVEQQVYISGTAGSKGGVTASSLGSFDVAGKTYPASSVVEGRVLKRLSVFKQGDELFVTRTSKPKLFAETPEGKIYTSRTLSISGSKQTGPISEYIGKNIFSVNKFNPDENSLISFSRPRTIEQIKYSSVNLKNEEFISGPLENSIFKRGATLAGIKYKEPVQTEPFSLKMNKKASLNLKSVQEEAPLKDITISSLKNNYELVSSIDLRSLPLPKQSTLVKTNILPTPIAPFKPGFELSPERRIVPKTVPSIYVPERSIKIISGGNVQVPTTVPTRIPDIVQIPIPSIVQIPNTRRKTTLDTSAIPKPVPNIIPDKYTPVIPPVIPPTPRGGFDIPKISPFFGGGIGGFIKKAAVKFRKQNRYIPSLTAAAFDLKTSRKQQSTGYTGLELRRIELRNYKGNKI